MFIFSAACDPNSHLRGQDARIRSVSRCVCCTVGKFTKSESLTNALMSASFENASFCLTRVCAAQAPRVAVRDGLVSLVVRVGTAPGTRDRERRAATQRFLSRLRLATNTVWMNSLKLLRVWPRRSLKRNALGVILK